MMSTKEEAASLSPTVRQVLDEFIGALKLDDSIDNIAVERLDELLRDGALPKPADIHAAMFQSPAEDET